MSGVKHFHKKEAARILIELRNKTEDVKLMDYRRQLLQNDGGEDESFNEFQDRLEQNLWPWAYPTPPFPPYNPNVVPFGYPYVSNPPLWFPSAGCVEPSPARYNLTQPFQAADFQHNLPWPQLAATQHQGFIDPGNVARRRRTKFTDEQLAILEKTFTHGSKFPSPGERMRLETRTGLSKEKISVWFQNRRAKEKRERSQEGTSKETEDESTTESEENGTEDEMQVRVCDETPGEESEIEDKGNQLNEKALDTDKSTVALQIGSLVEMKHIVGTKRSHVVQDLSSHFKDLDKTPNILYVENKPKESNTVEASSKENEPDITNACDVLDSDVTNTLFKVIDVTEDIDISKSKRDHSRFQNKKRKLFQSGQVMPNPDTNGQSHACSECRVFGET